MASNGLEAEVTKMSRRWGWLVLLAMIAGCEDVPADPENDRLPIGQAAKLFSAKADQVAVLRQEGTEMLPVGLKVEVVDDSQTDPETTHRIAVVTIREGALKGKSGRVYRDNLRPFTDDSTGR
jgi:hypothetical protein